MATTLFAWSLLYYVHTNCDQWCMRCGRITTFHSIFFWINNSQFVTTHTHQWYRKFETWINRKHSEGNSIDPYATNRPLPDYSCYRQNILLHILIKNSIKDFTVLKNNMRDSFHGSAIMKKKYVPFNLNLLAWNTIAIDLKIIMNTNIKSCSIKQLFIENNDRKMNLIWQIGAVDLALR